MNKIIIREPINALKYLLLINFLVYFSHFFIAVQKRMLTNAHKTARIITFITICVETSWKVTKSNLTGDIPNICEIPNAVIEEITHGRKPA